MRGARTYGGCWRPVFGVGLGPVLSLAVSASRLPAQTPPAGTSAVLASAAETITPAALIRTLEALAADSLQGRTTPSAPLERAARYLAAELQALQPRGLQPGGQDPNVGGGWLDRYPVPGQLQVSYEGSRLLLQTPVMWHGAPVLKETGYAEHRTVTLSLATEARLVTPAVAEGDARGSHAVLVAGTPDSAALARAAADLRSLIVLYVPPADTGAAATGRSARVLAQLRETARGIVVLVPEDAATFAARQQAAQRQPRAVVNQFLAPLTPPPPWVVEVRLELLAPLLAAAGIEPVDVRSIAGPVIRPLPQLFGGLELGVFAARQDTLAAPNVLGVLEGRDAALKRQLIVISTHFDTRPPAGSPADSLRVPGPGAPGRASAGAHAVAAADNAVGVAGLVALARAFAALDPAARPRRSLVFLAASGAAAGAWGSAYYADLGNRRSDTPLVLDIDLDLGAGFPGPGAITSLILDGLPDVELGVVPGWVAAAHPELELAVREGALAIEARGDHLAFVRRGVPALRVSLGAPTDSAGAAAGSARDTPGDTASPVPAAAPGDRRAVSEAAQATRLLRLVFYLVHAIADTDQRQWPRWSTAGRQRWAAEQP